MHITEVEHFSKQFKDLLDHNPEWPQIIQEGRAMLGELISNPDWFRSILSQLVLDPNFMDTQKQTIDINSIHIYLSPNRVFSVRAYIWEPGKIYPIHDHGLWGISGAHIHQVRERKFKRIDDGSDLNYAEVKLVSDTILSPGDTTFTLPMNDGIHQMEAVNDKVAVTIEVYSPPIRKGYIQYFDTSKNTARRIYSALNSKKVLAIRTLGSINESWAEDILSNSRLILEPDYIQDECRRSLDKLNR